MPCIVRGLAYIRFMAKAIDIGISSIPLRYRVEIRPMCSVDGFVDHIVGWLKDESVAGHYYGTYESNNDVVTSCCVWFDVEDSAFSFKVSFA